MKLAGILAVICVGYSVAPVALAQPDERVRFDYRDASGAECPDEEQLRGGVAARLGRNPFDSDAGKVLSAQVADDGVGLVATIELTDGQGAVVGNRTIRSKGKDCSQLVAAMEFAIAVAIDPLHAVRGPSKTESAEADSPQASPPPEGLATAGAPPVVTKGAQPARSKSSARFLGVGVLVAGGSEPRPTLGLTGHLGFSRGSLSLGVEGRFDLPSTKPIGSAGVRASLAAASLLACYRRGIVAGCALSMFGLMRASGVDFAENSRVTMPFIAPGARMALRIPFGEQMSLEVHGDLLVPLTQTVLVVDDWEAWESERIAAAFGVRMGWELP